MSSFYIQDGENKIEAFKSEINKKKSNAIKNQTSYNKVKTEQNIINTLNNLDFSVTEFKNPAEALSYYQAIGKTLDTLVSQYPDQIEFLYKEYDLRNFSVDNFFFELERRYDQGEISQTEALTELTNVMMALGPNKSKTDIDKYDELKKYLGETEGKSLEKRFPEVANLKKYGMKTVGETNDYGITIIGDQPTIDKMEDLNLELNRLVKIHGGLSTVFTTNDGKRMTIKNWYLGELRKIKNPDVFESYEFYDDAYNFSEPVPIEEEVNDSNNNGATINLNQQKILIYDKETKLFNEVDPSSFKTNANTIVVSMNGGLTQDGLELKDELNIDSFQNFNYKLYNRNFENKQTIQQNENLLSDDLEASTFSGDSPTTVEVQQGDTLSQLAEEFNVPLQEFMKVNNITNADLIRVGDELIVPMVEKINMKEVKNNQIKALDVILKDTDKTKVIPQTKIEDMLLAVGFEPEIAKIMAAVAMAESAGNPMIDTVKSGLDPNKQNEFSIGLLQINMKNDKERLLNLFDIESEQELYDPIINVIAAKRLYDEQGLNAWGAYKDNKYKQFLKN